MIYVEHSALRAFKQYGAAFAHAFVNEGRRVTNERLELKRFAEEAIHSRFDIERGSAERYKLSVRVFDVRANLVAQEIGATAVGEIHIEQSDVKTHAARRLSRCGHGADDRHFGPFAFEKSRDALAQQRGGHRQVRAADVLAGVAGEQRPEDHQLRGQKQPHAQRHRLVLLAQVVEVVRQRRVVVRRVTVRGRAGNVRDRSRRSPSGR